MMAYKGEIWLANLNPVKKANEVGKVRPVVIFQNNDLNESKYPTTIILPLTTSLIDDAEPLRLRVKKREKLLKDSDILIAQIRAIDNERLVEKLGTLNEKEVAHARVLLEEILN
jgi:mRNA interferase MazF